MPSDPPPLPEQTFFEDPVIDRLMGTTIALATEVYMLRSRLSALEQRLGILAEARDLPAGEQDAQEEAQRQDARAFVTHILGPLLGEQQARGPL